MQLSQGVGGDKELRGAAVKLRGDNGKRDLPGKTHLSPSSSWMKGATLANIQMRTYKIQAETENCPKDVTLSHLQWVHNRGV